MKEIGVLVLLDDVDVSAEVGTCDPNCDCSDGQCSDNCTCEDH